MTNKSTPSSSPLVIHASSGLSLTFDVEPGNDRKLDYRTSVFRPKRITVTLDSESDWISVSVQGVKVKKDGTDSEVTMSNPYIPPKDRPPYILAAIEATKQAFACFRDSYESGQEYP